LPSRTTREALEPERIIYTTDPYANTHHIDPIFSQGVDFSAVLLKGKAEGEANIPLEEYLKNHSGLGSYARINIVHLEDLEDSDSESGSSGPPPSARILVWALALEVETPALMPQIVDFLPHLPAHLYLLPRILGQLDSRNQQLPSSTSKARPVHIEVTPP
jgi:hypothetical protein